MSAFTNDARSVEASPVVENTHEFAQHESHRNTVATSASPADPGVELLRASDITPEPIQWVWPNYLARGKLHVMAGAPSTGKTALATAMAANVSARTPFPDGNIVEIPGDVVIWSGEDGIEDTLVPRLIAAGADLKRIHLVNGIVDGDGRRRAFDPSRDLPRLADALARCDNVSLVVIDSLVSVTTRDSHKNAETRKDLAPVQELAISCHAPVLGIMHFSKGTQGRDPLERVNGSLAFGALPRLVFCTVKREDGKRIFIRAKSNIGPEGDGFLYSCDAFTLPGNITTMHTRWLEPVVGTPRELLDRAEALEVSERKNQARDFLHDKLSCGPLPKDEVEACATNVGIAPRTLQRAAKQIGVKYTRSEFGGGTTWSME
jgi:RecA-family ATPase